MKIKSFEKAKHFWCGYKRIWYSENSRLTYDKITTNRIDEDQWGLDKVTGKVVSQCHKTAVKFFAHIFQVSSQFPRQVIGE